MQTSILEVVIEPFLAAPAANAGRGEALRLPPGPAMPRCLSGVAKPRSLCPPSHRNQEPFSSPFPGDADNGLPAPVGFFDQLSTRSFTAASAAGRRYSVGISVPER